MNMKMALFSIVGAVLASGSWAAPVNGTYEANWASLDARPVPQWWCDAKFGIFVHWGPYAVPAYAPTDAASVYACYSEWYHGRLLQETKPFLDHHAKQFANAPYGNFAAQFTAENFDPSAWATLFKKAGAKYTVLTSKHHDGYALWPSPESPYYNAAVLGAGRDLAGEFTAAMKAAGLRSGFYYSLLEYANPYYPKNFLKNPSVKPWPMKEWASRINLPQMKELAENYKADIIWTDGEWDFPDTEQLSTEFLAWLFNESSVKNEVVVNDRWGSGKCRGHHGGHYTTEYALDGGDQAGLSDQHPWEECRGIGRSFGYNRFEQASDYMSREKCIETLVAIVSAGGNLLLNVGPTADGRIPPIMEDRLLAMGRWLEVNGEAIYATTRGPKQTPEMKAARTYLTRKGETLYAITFGSGKSVSLPITGAVKSVSVLGSDTKVVWELKDNALVITPPTFAFGKAPCEHALVYKIDVL